jgi:hypothetical protein
VPFSCPLPKALSEAFHDDKTESPLCDHASLISNLEQADVLPPLLMILRVSSVCADLFNPKIMGIT